MERGKLGPLRAPLSVVPPQKLFGGLPSLLSDPFPHNPDPSFLGLQKGRMGAAERMEGEKTENGLGGGETRRPTLMDGAKVCAFPRNI